MNYNNLQIGEKIYYTGDMANLPAEGEIVERITDGWYPLTYKIKLNNGIESRVTSVMPSNFSGPGHRFELQSERKAYRNQQMQAMRDYLKTK